MPLSPPGTALLQALLALEGAGLDSVACFFTDKGHVEVQIVPDPRTSAHVALAAAQTRIHLQDMLNAWRLVCPIFDARPLLFPRAGNPAFGTGFRLDWRDGILAKQTTTLAGYNPVESANGAPQNGTWTSHKIQTGITGATLPMLLAVMERFQGPFRCWITTDVWPRPLSLLASDLDTAALLLQLFEHPDTVLLGQQPTRLRKGRSIVEYHPVGEVDVPQMLGHLWP